MPRTGALIVVAVITGWVLSAMPATTARGTASPQTPAALTGTGVLSGVVTTDETPPVPVRRATVRIATEGAPARLVGTDDEGRFVFDRLPARSYIISAAKPGFVTTFHGATRAGAGTGVPVAVADGARVTVTLALPRGAAITGLVRSPLGAPAPGVEVLAVALVPGGRGATPPARTMTDDRGQYRIAGLAAGDYAVSAIPRITPVGRGRNDQVFEVTDAEVRWAQARRAGLATGSPDAPAGAPVPPPGRPAAHAPVFHPGVTDVRSTAPVTVAIGEERGGIDLPLRVVPLARVTGTLVDESGDTVTSATVTLHPRAGDQPSIVDRLVASGAISLPRATVTAAGFTFGGVTPGEYTIVARSGAGRRGAAAPPPSAPTLWNVSDLFVDGDLDGVALRLLPGFALSGTVSLEASASARPGVGTMDLTLAPVGAQPAGATLPRATVAADGSFRFTGIAPGRYVIQAAGGSATWVLRSAMLEGRDLADVPFEARVGGRLDGLAVTFTTRAAGIGGRLVDASGRPVTRYSIVVCTTDRSLWFPGARRIRAVRPATDGTFAVIGLPPGTYAIAAVEDVGVEHLSDPGFLTRLIDAAYTVTLAEGERKQQDMRVGGER